MTTRVLVTFVARPNSGSERGVGWAFVSSAAEWTRTRGERLIVVVDDRDAEAVSAGLTGLALRDFVEVRGVSVPAWLGRRYGDSRSRATYMGWLPRARTEVRKIIREEPGVETIHQVTFASALLPNVLPRSGKIRAVWGPVNLRSGVVRPEGRRAPVIGLIALKMAPIFARWNARKVDLIIAANESTLRRFRRTKVTLEPPIFLDPMRLHETPSDPRRLVYCGKLTDLKRPWVAIDAMTDDRLAGYSLILLGEGPLGGAMKQRAIDAGIADRVIFAGQIERAVALEMIARSRALLHPSTTEGAAWAVGEAAALGVPSVVFENTGADTTVKLSDNGGIAVRSTGDLVGDFTAGIVQVLKGPRPAPVPRWDKTRISNLLDSWWAVE